METSTTNITSYVPQPASDFEKMNVLIVGNSGAGKSTLIKAIAGVEVQPGVGEAVTQNISVYESSTWPIRFIDTKGFEHDVFEHCFSSAIIIRFLSFITVSDHLLII